MSENLPPEEPGAPEDPTQQTRVPPPPHTPPAAPRRLVRTRGDRIVAGVGGGLGRYFGIDPVIARIALVLLSFFGGAGLLLYLAAVLLVPDEGEAGVDAGSPPPRTDRQRGLVVLGVVLLVCIVGPVLFAPSLIAGSVLGPLAFLVVAGLLVHRLVTGRRPAREFGALARATAFGLGVLVLVGCLAVGAFWGAGVGGETVVAVAVIAAGLALVAAAFVRPARWLILPALAVALPAAFVGAAGIDLDGGVGDRTYRPAAATALPAAYRLGAGQMTVDLRHADLPAGDHPLKVRVGMGEAVVIVPDDVCVTTDAQLGMGAVNVFDRDSGGIDVGWVDETQPRPGNARLVLDADIGLGHLDVRHSDQPSDGIPGHRLYDSGDAEDGRLRGRNTGCAA